MVSLTVKNRVINGGIKLRPTENRVNVARDDYQLV